MSRLVQGTRASLRTIVGALTVASTPYLIHAFPALAFDDVLPLDRRVHCGRVCLAWVVKTYPFPPAISWSLVARSSGSVRALAPGDIWPCRLYKFWTWIQRPSSPRARLRSVIRISSVSHCLLRNGGIAAWVSVED